ncbi:MAG: dockerin type I repeat-containing protein [Ruminococcus sp.]|nr:dockerin type I repeat-containing protein [Ruminococcus sp.]
MRFNKIISVIMSLVVTATVNILPVRAEYEDGLLELYRTYFEDYTIIDLKYDKNKSYPELTSYKLIKKPFDYIRMRFTDSDIEYDCNELAELLGCDPDKFTVSYDNYRNEQKYLTITFSTHNHEDNKDIAEKLYKVLNEKHKISYACIYIDAKNISSTYSIGWNNFYGKDELGYSVAFKDQFSKKKVNEIRNRIADNDFPVEIDADDNIIFDETASESDKFRFAYWLDKEYGFRVLCSGYDMPLLGERYNITEVMHYSGDVNNDNEVTFEDAEVLNNYLLTGSTEIFNVSNADLTGDGVIDVFDLLLLKKQLVEIFFDS